MKLKVILLIAAVYMALVGIGHLFAPIAMSAGVIPADASPGVAAFLRHYSALFLAVALLNWLARDVPASPARNAVVAANLSVFGLGGLLDLAAVLGGAGPAGLVPASMNLLIAALFVWAARASA